MAGADYGRLIPAEEAGLSPDPEGIYGQQPQASTVTADANPLWDYTQTGRINGVPVKESDQGLPVDSVDLLSAAFEMEATPRLFTAWISPDHPEGVKAYEALLEMAGNNEVVLGEETRQYDAQHSAFLVMLRYSEVCYRLHRRFDYLREEEA